MARNVLLIEPNYKNKYPPIGLMKLATYHKMIGDNVVFYKGDLKEFMLNQTTELCIEKFNKIDYSIDWKRRYFQIKEFVKTRHANLIDEIKIEESKYELLLLNALTNYKDYYWKGGYKTDPYWDRICITTLFTFHWDITIDTIDFLKKIVKTEDELWVGGIMATVLNKELKKESRIKNVYKGQLDKAGVLDKNDIVIDDLPLDYSILNEIEYKYPENNAYYGYMTRGCIRKCPFCAVPKLEPEFNHYIPLDKKLKDVKKIYGEKRNLLLLDNNVLASDCFKDIINEIKKNGFTVGSKYIEPNQLEISIRNLKNGTNDRAYIRKTVELFNELLSKLKGEEKQKLFEVTSERGLLKYETASKNNILEISGRTIPLFEKVRNKSEKSRYVDFNQGVDAREINNETIKLLAQVPIRPLRIAFDKIEWKKIYINAVLLAKQHGIRHFSNYLLYNYTDKPEDLYKRLKVNVELCESEDIDIYSFPMKYHPIFGDQRLNRDHIGPHWNRKFIRAVQAILNATKGTIGRGESYFYKAFGQNEDEFFKLMYMPETYLLHRYFFEWNGRTEEWRNIFENELTEKEIAQAKIIIEGNEFKDIASLTHDKKIIKLLEHYTITRGMIYETDKEIMQQKKKFDGLKNEEKYDFYKTQ